VVFSEVALANVEALLGEHDDRPAFWGLVCERRELGGLRKLHLAVPASGDEGRGHPVPEGDRAGLVEEQGLDVTGRLYRPSAHREHVALHEAVHPGDPNCREQRPDGGRDEADEQ
jgi:hypothetical protein